ncbi:MAG: helix-turn-helix domain-containing protein [Bryobacteraceae bacterium]
MGDLPVNPEVYGALLAQARPCLIETMEEHERLLDLAERLMEKGDSLSPEERKLLKLLVFVIEAFERALDDEEEKEESHPPAPHETLRRMMEARDLDIQDILHVFGNPDLAREVLEGRREITKSQAKELGTYFRMPFKLFLS